MILAKVIVDAKVIGQKVLSPDVRQIDFLAPEIARQALPGQFVNVQTSMHTANLL